MKNWKEFCKNFDWKKGVKWNLEFNIKNIYVKIYQIEFTAYDLRKEHPPALGSIFEIKVLTDLGHSEVVGLERIAIPRLSDRVPQIGHHMSSAR